jgi:DNA gyrase/topoisomerase IV subunit B
VGLDLAIAWVDGDADHLRTLVNGWATGGPHVTALFAALHEVLARRVATVRRLDGERFRSTIARGMVAFQSVTLAEPRYRSATRAELENPEVGPAVRELVAARFGDFVTEDPATLDWLLTHRFG